MDLFFLSTSNQGKTNLQNPPKYLFEYNGSYYNSTPESKFNIAMSIPLSFKNSINTL